MANEKYLDNTGLQYFWTKLKALLALKAPLASPTLTGTPLAPTAAAGNSTTQIATTAFVQTAIDGIENIVTASGKIIHVADAIAGETVKSLDLFNSGGTEVTGKTVAITNKNLFRIDLLPSSVTNKGVTFTKNADGSITASGTSTGTYASTTCNIDKNAFVPGQVYTMSCGKTSGDLYVQLALTYTDNTTDYLVSRVGMTTFMVPKAVATATGSVQITASGTTINQTLWPQIELAGAASTFANNTYTQITYTGSNLPTLPASTSNVWSNSDDVTSITMTYLAEAASAYQEADEKSASLSMAKANTADLAVVATSGSYTDLSDQPTIPSISDLIDIFYPVGTYYETDKTQEQFNPNTAWGGTWVLETAGLVHVSAGTDYAISANAQDGGNKDAIVPKHSHTLTRSTNVGVTVNSSGSCTTGGMSANESHHHQYSYQTGTRTAGSVSTRLGPYGSGTYTDKIDSSNTSIAHTHTVPNHTHTLSITQPVFTCGDTGDSATNANMMPYKNVNRWHRTA